MNRAKQDCACAILKLTHFEAFCRMRFGYSLVVFSLSLTIQGASGKYGSVINRKIYVGSDFVLNSDEDVLKKLR